MSDENKTITLNGVLYYILLTLFCMYVIIALISIVLFQTKYIDKLRSILSKNIFLPIVIIIVITGISVLLSHLMIINSKLSYK